MQHALVEELAKIDAGNWYLSMTLEALEDRLSWAQGLYVEEVPVEVEDLIVPRGAVYIYIIYIYICILFVI